MNHNHGLLGIFYGWRAELNKLHESPTTYECFKFGYKTGVEELNEAHGAARHYKRECEKLKALLRDIRDFNQSAGHSFLEAQALCNRVEEWCRSD